MKFSYIKFSFLLLILQNACAMYENQLIQRKVPGSLEMPEFGRETVSVWPLLTDLQKAEVHTQIEWFKAGACGFGVGELLYCSKYEPVMSCAAHTVSVCCGYPLTSEQCNHFVTTAHWSLQFFGLILAGSSYDRIRQIRDSVSLDSEIISE